MLPDHITCKGSYALGTACGKCRKCKEELQKMNEAEPKPEERSDEQIPAVMCRNAEQEQLFNRIIDMKNRVQNLAGYMQNPFFDMLNDGYISKDEINRQMWQMEVDVSKFIDELTEIKIRCNRIFRHYGT